MYSKFLFWKKNQIPVDETTVCIKFKISNEHENFCHECGKWVLNKNNLLAHIYQVQMYFLVIFVYKPFSALMTNTL